MRWLASVALVFVTGCATTASPPPTPARLAARGPETIAVTSERSYYFQNLSPNCLAFELPGVWEFSEQALALRTPDRRRYVGVISDEESVLARASGADTIERVVGIFTANLEKDFGTPVTATAERFVAAHPAVIVRFAGDFRVTPDMARRALGGPAPPVGTVSRPFARVVFRHRPGWMTVITVPETDEELARQVIATLRFTDERQCWKDELERRFSRQRA